ncbi:diacylglycerol/lipid kinase family protein [Microbacterium xanthum]|uniref:diacylglycerol/lipid kinase family protein n=1 Tax=Microbacterium xanthum TaxID=3079794 RepID=UPI002AD56E6D|nr:MULTISPECIES: diacylglycerol kinase family protein [unclassified Microbacterium]MDZ8171624.1 diacylglycerol kinase family protein [Microbacterium sp. KSW-48]MDZ8200290.1 diacylglycerol kinase family protein [Microbacterium sp. SSW1-59]
MDTDDVTGRGLLIVLNPSSGRDRSHEDPRPLIDRRVPEATVHELSEGEDLVDVVEAAMVGEEPPTAVAMHGGDGSVSTMAHVARRHGIPLLVLPAGTFNHFSRALGIETVEDAIDAYVADRRRRVAVAEVRADDEDPITVLDAVTLGLHPGFVAERKRRVDRLGTWIGGAAAAWRELRGAEPIRVGRDGRHADVWSVFVSVGENSAARIATLQRITLGDDRLDVRFHHARGSRVRAIASLAFGRKTTAVLRFTRLLPPESDIERTLVPQLDITVRRGADGNLSFVHDGELERRDGEAFRLRVEGIPAALEVYAPA